jgi:hypothetical protein
MHPSQVEVPDGVVTTELSPGRIARFIVRSVLIGPTASGLDRDIVVYDSSGQQEFYREGHYDQITVNTPLRKVVAEIEQHGLDDFLRKRKTQNAQLGPVTAPSGRVPVTTRLSVCWGAVKRSVLGIRRFDWRTERCRFSSLPSRGQRSQTTAE